MITKEVLRKDLSWEDMKDKLSNLKKHRDAAAHHNHFTEKKKKAALSVIFCKICINDKSES